MSQIKKYINKEDFVRDRLSMHFGSLTNLYSGSPNPPHPDELFKKAIEITEKVWEAGYQFDEFEELEDILKKKTFEEYNLHERTIGRYYASELYDYFTEKIKPEEFLNPPLPDDDELRRMYWGTLVHEGIQKLFDYEELTYEIPIEDDIVLACKPDLILPDGTVIEIKTKENISLYDKIPVSWEYQCQAYMQALNKKEMKLYLFGWGLSRKLFIVKRDEKIWENIVKRLKFYHQKVVLAYRQRE
ncbi:MAG: hypothetical protein ABIM54_00940 [candidate division WOR-3 bacterium]